MLKKGIYEQIINKKIDDELTHSNSIYDAEAIDDAEASKILSKYMTEIFEHGLDTIKDNHKSITDQISLVNKVVKLIKEETSNDYYDDFEVIDPAKQLLSLYDKNPNEISSNTKKVITRPETSIAQSSLFTGAIHEPQLFSELKKEIASCNKIDMLVSFIKWSGLRLIIDDLKKFTQAGGTLRVITTSYMGATDIKAIEELSKLANTSIKISYDTKRTRLHAKTYIFYRDTGFTTAYVGSSNLSNAAISSGLEWNVKVTKKDLPDTITKIEATYESYWNSIEFDFYTEHQKSKLAKALKAERYHQVNDPSLYTLDITPYPYQQEILDQLEAERKLRGNYYNLLCAATGCGKTVISALDYRNYYHKYNKTRKCNLLFVAHREEILKQSLATFRAVLKEGNFGEMYVGNYKPEQINHLFISIQTFNSQDFTSKTSTDFYDFIIIDEFHHAAAPTYQKLLEYYKPKILLGLTATPERMDGKNILKYFNNRIAAEIRLPEAINRKLLCPFQYFGVTDSVDLSSLKWSRGSYDKQELSKIYTDSYSIANNRADLIVRSLFKYINDIDEVKGIGFCVSVNHAEFMSHYFNAHNIPSIYLTGQSDQDLRDNAKDKLTSGTIKFIFVVDIYNEGVDIPEVNTILFLRPTESLTVYLQQLGRGLRLPEGKECLTVLDFIGQANKRYNFEEKYLSMLSDHSLNLTQEISRGFVSLPKGCYIQLEKIAQKYILDNIKASFTNSLGITSKIRNFEEDTGKHLTLSNFLTHYHLDPRSIYKFNSFTRLCVNAGVIHDFNEPNEEILTKALYRLASIDSLRWIQFLIHLFTHIDTIIFKDLSLMDKRMLQMLAITIWNSTIMDWENDDIIRNIQNLKNNPHLLNEFIELLKFNLDKIDFVDEQIMRDIDIPLDLHCTYSRDQLLVAMDHLNPSNVREGAKWLPDKKTDIFMVTLNKSDKDYSPTTMYNDYSINDTLFHWQSQSTVSVQSNTGQRYINHRKHNSKILLFIREFKKDVYGKTANYTFLGYANYVSHSGSRPINIIWELERPIPAKYLKKTNKLVM